MGEPIAYVSTRGHGGVVDFSAALMLGLARDGGLWVPSRWPPGASGETFAEALRVGGVPGLATELLAPFVGASLPGEGLAALLAEALDFPLPVRRLTDRIAVLELFHGPTLAFKDVGARVMARLTARLDPGDGPLTVLVATSGDTGSAVASAYHGVPATRVVVLFPRGQVSLRQERQMTTLGGNVTALAVDGTFDDCQALAKAAFRDQGLARRHRLTSANSINLGRLLPQMVYWVVGALGMGGEWEMGNGEGRPASPGTSSPFPDPHSPLLACVPSGNFGNLCAGLWARILGAPIDHFVAATNANDVVPEWLATGELRPRPSTRTIANAMDVGDPSNVERIRWTVGDDLEALRGLVTASAHDDASIRAAIVRAHQDYGAVLCPHAACGLLALEAALEARPEARGLLLATAHPAKFAEVVEPLLGPQPVPTVLAEALERESLALEIAPTLEALGAVLEDLDEDPSTTEP